MTKRDYGDLDQEFVTRSQLAAVTVTDRNKMCMLVTCRLNITSKKRSGLEFFNGQTTQFMCSFDSILKQRRIKKSF